MAFRLSGFSSRAVSSRLGLARAMQQQQGWPGLRAALGWEECGAAARAACRDNPKRKELVRCAL